MGTISQTTNLEWNNFKNSRLSAVQSRREDQEHSQHAVELNQNPYPTLETVTKFWLWQAVFGVAERTVWMRWVMKNGLLHQKQFQAEQTITSYRNDWGLLLTCVRKHIRRTHVKNRGRSPRATQLCIKQQGNHSRLTRRIKVHQINLKAPRMAAAAGQQKHRKAPPTDEHLTTKRLCKFGGGHVRRRRCFNAFLAMTHAKLNIIWNKASVNEG